VAIQFEMNIIWQRRSRLYLKMYQYYSARV
jgi:hypothetical protein